MPFCETMPFNFHDFSRPGQKWNSMTFPSFPWLDTPCRNASKTWVGGGGGGGRIHLVYMCKSLLQQKRLRIWHRNKSTFNRSQYMQKVHQYNRICMQAKSEFLKAKIQDNHHNPKKLWRVLGDVLQRLPAKMLPLINAPQLLADRFVSSSQKKIAKIHSTFPTSLNSQHITPDSPPPKFSTFSTVIEDQVTKIIMKSPSRSCSLDPGPTFLVLHYLDILITPITSIINASLEQGKCANFFKQAHVPQSSKNDL